jgi:hypothetical protein
MIESIGHRLRIVLHRHDPDGPPEVEMAADGATAMREVEFVAYGEDFVVSGQVRMDADRLTDMLNTHDEYLLSDVLVERLDDGHADQVEEVLVQRHEVMLVHATGPRGHSSRRRRTRAYPVELRIASYRLGGYLHALPGIDPIEAMNRRDTMVPLTDAWIEYESGSVHQLRRAGTLVVNRHHIDQIVPAATDEIEMPDLPVKDQGPLLKDFTGVLFEGR